MLVYICSTALYPREIVNESESTPGKEYLTVAGSLFNDSMCDCPGWHFREDCKHVKAIRNCDFWDTKEEWDRGMWGAVNTTHEQCPKCLAKVILYETDPEDYNGKKG